MNRRLSLRPRAAAAVTLRALAALAIFALLAVLGWGVLALFELRHQRGDVYPAYSSLRADPLGAKAIFDSLAGLPGFEVERNFRPLVRLKPATPVTLVYAGVDYEARWGEDELREFEGLITTGSRAVFAFKGQFKSTSEQRLRPGRRTPGKEPRTTPAPGATPAPKGQREAADEEEAGAGVPFRDAAARWGFAFDLAQDEEAESLHAETERAADAGDLEEKFPWHSALYFKGLNPKWRVLHTCNGVPVVAERPFGSGHLVIASDAYFLSNEGLRVARAPKLIAHLLGPPRRVIFDEEHHGVTEEMNLATLARKHQLEGAVLSILFVVGLFVWKNAVPFLPSRAERRAARDGDVAGADATTGFVNLLRRSIPPARILAVCVEEWRKAQGRRARAGETAHIDSVMRAHTDRGAAGRDAAAAYRTIAEGLRRA